jgi:hypothetical protein
MREEKPVNDAPKLACQANQRPEHATLPGLRHPFLWSFLLSVGCLIAWMLLLPGVSQADPPILAAERTPVIVTLTPTPEVPVPSPSRMPALPVVSPTLEALQPESTRNITDDCAVRIDNNSTTYTSIQAAVNVAQSGATLKIAGYCSQIQSLVSPDDYPGPQLIRQVALIETSLHLRGGYNATNWDEPPDPVAYPTVLDARQMGRVLVISGNITPTIEDLQLINGDAGDQGGYQNVLGEMFDAGGAVYVLNASPTIRDSELRSSTAAIGGSAALIGSAALLEENMIRSSTAARGGGVALLQSPATLRGNAIYNNTSTQSGGGLYLETSGARLINNDVWGNSAASDGGGAYLTISSAAMEGNTIHENRATLGGGLYLKSSNSVLNAERVQYNTAATGGGVYVERSNAWLTNMFVTNNILTDTMGNGGGIYLFSSSPRLWHMTITRNTGGDGSGIFMTDDGNTPSTLAMSNTILLSQTVGLVVVGQSRAVLAGTLWGAGIWANGEGGDVALGGDAELEATVNLMTEPDFRSPFTGDYHIGMSSGALDRGISSSVARDIDGDRRPSRHGFDIGADELMGLYLPIITK